MQLSLELSSQKAPSRNLYNIMMMEAFESKSPAIDDDVVDDEAEDDEEK